MKVFDTWKQGGLPYDRFREQMDDLTRELAELLGPELIAAERDSLLRELHASSQATLN